MTVQRWKCTSYCLCGSRKGHFEQSDEGVWVRYEAAHALEQENERLRKQLSARLQELERIKRKRLDWAMLCDHDCPACTELDDAIRGDVPQSAEQT